MDTYSILPNVEGLFGISQVITSSGVRLLDRHRQVNHSMNSGVWGATGILCGFALGIILPIGMAYLIILTADDAKGIGTPFSLLLIFTVPMGMMLGNYAGRYRARTGHWKGVFSASTLKGSPAEVQSHTLARKFAALDMQLAELPEAEVASTRTNYLRELVAEYEAMKPNYRLFAIWIVASVLIPFLVIVPIKMAWEHYRRKKTLSEHIQEVMSVWSVDATFFP